jgi:NTP pyrophosphatase (non-canonical NTP hydrolase)
MTAEWREETLEGDPTPTTQAMHTATEVAEVADLLVKGSTYEGGGDVVAVDNKLLEETGDVVVAHLGTMTLCGVDAGDAFAAAVTGKVDGGSPLAQAGNVLHETSMLVQRLTGQPGGYGESSAARRCFAVLQSHDALLGLLGVSMEEAVAAALEKNGARDWADHQEEATS